MCLHLLELFFLSVSLPMNLDSYLCLVYSAKILIQYVPLYFLQQMVKWGSVTNLVLPRDSLLIPTKTFLHSCTHSMMTLRTLSLCQTTTRSVDCVSNCGWNINDVVYHQIRSYDVRRIGNGTLCINCCNNIIAVIIGDSWLKRRASGQSGRFLTLQ